MLPAVMMILWRGGGQTVAHGTLSVPASLENQAQFSQFVEKNPSGRPDEAPNSPSDPGRRDDGRLPQQVRGSSAESRPPASRV